MSLHRVRGKILGDRRPSDVSIERGRIVSIRPAGRGDADLGSDTAVIVPPLFDIQVNGYGGVDLQDSTLTADKVLRLNSLLAQTGVGHWVPTLVTGPQEGIEHGCRVLAEAMRNPALKGAIPGIHIEGPYISPEDGPRGAHRREHVRPPSLREFDRWMKAADGKILYITMSPEWKGAATFIKGVASRGVVVSIGHHNATPAQIACAVDAGATLCTHLGNGMASQMHRHHNPLWPQLADDRLSASLIADMEHLPAEILKTFVRVKGPERIVLTSDVVHLGGMKPGHYAFAGKEVELKPSGRICLSGTDLLAGSSLMLLQGVLNAVKHAELTLEQACACATTVPARLLQTSLRFPLPKPGAKARFTVFETDSKTGRVKKISTVGF
ncbi:MAG: amidohydrolase family protein [Candidatus Hydrogenedentes bacterium]|nr:amidohydrolase family protein [Candidatus Hydrogenedentota bacterium]